MQANLGLVGNPKSLVMRWAEFMLSRLMSYVSWPVETLKFDDLLALYQAREQRDACATRYTLRINVTTSTVTQVTTTATGGSGTCRAPLMYPVTATLNGTGITAGPASGAGVNTSLLSFAAPSGRRQVVAISLPW
jgi:hypothetical protein